MVGYDMVNSTTNYALPMWLCLLAMIGVLLYKFWMAIESYDLDYDYMKAPDRQKKRINQGPPPPKRIGKTMKCRRYRVVNGKLTVYYTEVETGVDEFSYYAGVNTTKVKALAPKGTEYVYLNCQREWGYSEAAPAPPCLVFGSKDMMQAIDTLEDVKIAGI